MDDLNKLREHLDSRLDKLEDKLDVHIERISKAETSIEFLKGHAKISIMLILSALGALASSLYNLLIHKG